MVRVGCCAIVVYSLFMVVSVVCTTWLRAVLKIRFFTSLRHSSRVCIDKKANISGYIMTYALVFSTSVHSSYAILII